jgi:sugar phosphate isomerase/epimerase
MSTGCLYQLPPEGIADAAVEAGFKYIEVLLNPPMLEDMGPMARALESRGLKVTVVHAPFTMDALLSAPGRRREAKAEGVKALDACKAVGSPVITLHPGASPPPGFSKKKHIDTARANLDRLQTLAAVRGIELIVENTSAYYVMGVKVSGLLGNDPAEMEAFVGPPDRPARRMTFDTSHASTLHGVTIEAFIREMGTRIANLHLSDSIGTYDHLPIGRGRIDFRKVFEALRAIHFDGNATLELRPKVSTPEELRRNRVLVETELSGRNGRTPEATTALS